jgi:hypothetical protein
MEICVSGWYFESEFVKQVAKVSYKYPVTIIIYSDRALQIPLTLNWLDNISQENQNFDYYITGVGGQEWGDYDYYIKNLWTGDDVLFVHDDIIIHDMIFFDKIKDELCDQGYIFHSWSECLKNSKIHGRGVFMRDKAIRHILNNTYQCADAKPKIDRHNNIFCSDKCYQRKVARDQLDKSLRIEWVHLKDKEKGRKRCCVCHKEIDSIFLGSVLMPTGPYRGVWYDIYNDGYVSGGPPLGVRHHNEGVYHFAERMKRMEKKGWDTDKKLIYPEFEHARRGKFKMQ